MVRQTHRSKIIGRYLIRQVYIYCNVYTLIGMNNNSMSQALDLKMSKQEQERYDKLNYALRDIEPKQIIDKGISADGSSMFYVRVASITRWDLEPLMNFKNTVYLVLIGESIDPDVYGIELVIVVR